MLPLFLWEVGRGLTTNDTSLAGIVGAVHWRVKTPQNIEVGLFLQASSTKQLHILHKRFQPFFIYIHVSFLAPVFAHYCPATRMASNIFFASKNFQQQYPTQGTRNHITSNWKFGKSSTQTIPERDGICGTVPQEGILLACPPSQ